jgi:aldehyde dehydrogenase (NAD+)
MSDDVLIPGELPTSGVVGGTGSEQSSVERPGGTALRVLAGPLSRTETFGPVVSVTRFRTEDEAVAIANDTVYGLVNYVQTSPTRCSPRGEMAY